VKLVRFDVLTAVVMNAAIFLDIAPSSRSSGYKISTSKKPAFTRWLGHTLVSCSCWFYTLKMAMITSSETSDVMYPRWQLSAVTNFETAFCTPCWNGYDVLVTFVIFWSVLTNGASDGARNSEAGTCSLYPGHSSLSPGIHNCACAHCGLYLMQHGALCCI
jgi:hypothetical protein